MNSTNLPDLDGPNLNAFVWTAPNPFGEPSAFLLLTPADNAVAAELKIFGDRLGLQQMGFGGDIPWVGTDYLSVALRGLVADLGVGADSWLKVQVSDQWTSNAIGRRYIVLAVGTGVTSADLDPSQISEYLHGDHEVLAGLVKIRLRVTDQ